MGVYRQTGRQKNWRRIWGKNGKQHEQKALL